MTAITITHSALSAFIFQVLSASGMRNDDATTVADVLTWANLRGVDSHGVSRLPGYVSEIASGQFDPTGRPVLRSRLPGTFVLDCSGTAGPVCMMEAVGRCVSIASELGVGVGVVSAPTHVGAIGFYTQSIAKHGHAGLVMVAGRLLMAYHGARTPSLGTSPISIAVPGSEDEPPLMLDMASGLIAAGRIHQAALEGLTLPENAAIDVDGNLTSDPAFAKTVLPLGGPKGSGLALLFECLTGILAGTPIIAAAANAGKIAPIQNATVIVLNVESFRSLADYRVGISELRHTIKKLPRRQGFEELLLPGERGDREAARRKKDGIPIPADVWKELEAMSGRSRVAMPARG
jgi:ureidoglycolate dehydrogenase (NAD+)